MAAAARAALLAAAVAAARPALAQGTSRTLPSPISSRDLVEYARVLNLSDAQRVAIEPFHEQYKDAFRELRDGPIQAYLDEQSSLGLGFMRASREDLVRRIDGQRRLLGGIEALDRRFFSDLSTILSEDQQPRIERVVMARQRARYAGMSTMMWAPGAQVDLARLAWEADWTGPDRDGAEPVLAPYERRLTKLVSELHERAARGPLEMHDAMVRAGFDPAKFAEAVDMEPADREAMFTAMQNARREVDRAVLETATEVSRLNQSTFRSLAAVLSAPAADGLRDGYYRRAYFEAWPDPGLLTPRLEQAMKLEVLSAEQKEQIATLKAEYRARHEAVTGEMIERLDAHRSTTPFFSLDDEGRLEHEEAMRALHDRRAQLNSTVLEALRGIVGEERAASIAGPPAEPPMVGRGRRSIAMGDGPMPVGGEIVATTAGPGMVAVTVTADASSFDGDSPTGDPFVPPPINQREVEAYRRLLGLDEAAAAVLNELHDEYDRQVRGSTDARLAPLRETNERLRPGPQRAKENRPTLEQVDQLAVTRRELVQEVRALDESFFRDVEAALVEPGGGGAAMERVRLARQRAVYNRGGGGGPMMFMAGMNSREASVDLTDLVNGVELPADARAAIDPLLADYERAVTPAMQSRFEKSLDARNTMERVQVSRMDSDGGVRISSDDEEFMQTMQRARQMVRESSEAVAAINRDHLARLRAAMPPPAAESLRVAYNRRAFPAVFADPDAAEPRLQAAARLAELSSEQRERLQLLAADHGAKYQEICDRMTEIESKSGRGISMAGPTVTVDAEQIQALQERQNALGRLRFERQELNASTLRRLREILTAEQYEKAAPGA
jgi:hypothetical protein